MNSLIYSARIHSNAATMDIRETIGEKDSGGNEGKIPLAGDTLMTCTMFPQTAQADDDGEAILPSVGARFRTRTNEPLKPPLGVRLVSQSYLRSIFDATVVEGIRDLALPSSLTIDRPSATFSSETASTGYHRYPRMK